MPEYFDDPHTCPWCGQTEPNAFLLQNNHWVKTPRGSGFDWCREHGLCVAMDLTRNHVTYYVRMLTDPDYQRGHCACWKHRTWKPECARAELRRCIARVEQVWPLPRRAWVEDYRHLSLELVAPVHHAVPDSEEQSLFGGAA